VCFCIGFTFSALTDLSSRKQDDRVVWSADGDAADMSSSNVNNWTKPSDKSPVRGYVEMIEVIREENSSLEVDKASSNTRLGDHNAGSGASADGENGEEKKERGTIYSGSMT
jgi:hypothetical protein